MEAALARIARTVRQSIAEGDANAQKAFLPLYMLLLGAWAESRLNKVLYEPQAFTDGERQQIKSGRTHLDKWLNVVELGFRRHYHVPHAELSRMTLPFSAAARYSEIVNLLNTDLKVVIELRNKLAHGQWEYPLVTDGNDVSSDLKKLMLAENLLSLQFKKSLISAVLNIVNDLAVSPPTFERDFDNHYRLIVETRRSLEMRRYDKYVLSLITKRQRGIAQRSASVQEP